ncbi:MAG: hypothetical protein P4M09_04930, partial [Devosia sp.]|nr:hypothetical protein [Devosia sp.]
TVTLDVRDRLDTANTDGTLTTVAGINFLGDKGDSTAPTLIDFVQGFALSADTYARLGGLASLSTFHAQPGIDLTYAGNVTLVSNWNLGAGIVNQDAAIAAGVMGTSGSQTYVVLGQESALLANYTEFLYRAGGKATGEAPVLSLRAGGNLHLSGSLTDGFFQFGDQYDPTYQKALLAKLYPSSSYALALSLYPLDNRLNNGPWATLTDFANFCFATADCSDRNIFQMNAGGSDASYVPLNATASSIYIPYSVIANSPAALGSGANGTGDPLGSAVIFPLLPDKKVVASSSFALSAGADLASINSLRVNPISHATFTLDGEQQQSYTVTVNGATVTSDLLFGVGPQNNQRYVSSSDWLTAMLSAFPSADPDVAVITFNSFGQSLRDAFSAFAIAHPDMVSTAWQDYDTFGFTVRGFSLFVTSYLPTYQQGMLQDLQSNRLLPTPPSGTSTTRTVVMNPQTMIRSGTGSIAVAASGTIDLTNGKVMRDGSQVGGTAIYTAGHPVVAAVKTVTDPSTGLSVSVDLASALPSSNNLASAASYAYGQKGTDGAVRSVAGIVVADPVALEGGGSITVSAGGDVLGQRDAWLNQSIGAFPSPSGLSTWIGSNAEPWRIGATGADTYAAINPQLFTDGIATLGGGAITVTAGRGVSDLAVVATSSLATATVTGAGVSTKAIATFGGGNVTIAAASDILGGRVDVASGAGLITAGGDITANDRIPSNLLLLNLLRLYMSDATVDIEAGGSLTLQGVAALGPQQYLNIHSINGSVVMNNVAASTFYSDNAALNLQANGSVTVTNTDDALLTYNASVITSGGQQSVYPGSFSAVALTGDIDLRANVQGVTVAKSILLVPSPVGQLSLLAGGDIASTSIAMLDTDPGSLPGALSFFQGSFGNGIGLITVGTALAFP